MENPYLDYEDETAFDTATFTAYMGFEWTSQEAICMEGMTGDVVPPAVPSGCDIGPAAEAVGHRATFDASAVIRNHDPGTDDLCEYYDAMLTEDAIGVPHHLGQPLLAPPSFEGGCFNALVQPVTEVKSVHGIYEPQLATKLRESGKRFGVIASGDDHGARPGLDGIAGVWMLEEQGGIPVGTPLCLLETLSGRDSGVIHQDRRGTLPRRMARRGREEAAGSQRGRTATPNPTRELRAFQAARRYAWCRPPSTGVAMTSPCRAWATRGSGALPSSDVCVRSRL